MVRPEGLEPPTFFGRSNFYNRSSYFIKMCFKERHVQTSSPVLR